MPLQCIIKEPNEKSDVHTQTRHGKIIRKPDRLTYLITLMLDTVWPVNHKSPGKHT